MGVSECMGGCGELAEAVEGVWKHTRTCMHGSGLVRTHTLTGPKVPPGIAGDCWVTPQASEFGWVG